MIEGLMSKPFEQSALSFTKSFDLPNFFKENTNNSRILNFNQADAPLFLENLIEFKELTLEQQDNIKEKTGWSDDQLNKCTISDDGVVYYKCDNEEWKGNVHPCGIQYTQKQIEYNGMKIELVSPDFNSVFDVQLDKESYTDSNIKQFKSCNAQLKEAIDIDDALKVNFNQRQLAAIEIGKTPEGYTWHHDVTPGKMQLVERKEHDRTIGGAAHTGGRSIWGGGY